MNKFFTVLTALVAVSMISPANAADCVPEEQSPEADTGDTGVDTDGDGSTDRFYLDNDVCQLDGCLFSIWVYQESNGINGLQREDEASGPEACGNPDTIIL